MGLVASAPANKECSSPQAPRRASPVSVTSTNVWLLALVQPGDGARFLQPTLSYLTKKKKSGYSLIGFHRTSRCGLKGNPRSLKV